MGMQQVRPLIGREFHGKLPAIVIRKPKPVPKPLTLRQRYRAALASLPLRVGKRPVAHLIVRALLQSDLPWRSVIGGRRLPHIAAVKQRVAWMLYETTEGSGPIVAKIVGLKDHTTVLHARRRMEALIAEGATVDRGIPFLRPRDIARVAKIKETAERMARIQKEEDEARERAEAAAYAARVHKRQMTVLGCIARTVGLEHQPVIEAVLRKYSIAPSRLVGPLDSKRACRARDKICFQLSRLGVHRDTLASAFAVGKGAVTKATHRGELAAQELRP